MKKFLLLFFCCCTFAALAQEERVVWGNVIKLPKNREARGILGRGGQHFYLLQLPSGRKEKKISIEKFSATNLLSEATVEIELEETDEYNTIYEDLYLLNDRLILFTSRYNREKRTHSAHALVLDTELKQQGDWKEIDSYSIESSRSTGTYSFSTGPGDSLLLVKRHMPGTKDDLRNYYFLLLQNNLEIIWQKQIELPYANRYVEVPEIFVEQTGNLFMLCSISSEKKKSDRGMGSYFNKYLLIGFFPKENILREYELSLDDKHITAVTARADKKGKITVGGFYGRKSQYSIEGTFYLTLDIETRKPDKLSLKAFENEIMMELQDAENSDENELFNNFYFDHFVLNDDGTSYLVAEEYFKQSHSYFDPITQLYYDSYTYHYNDIIIVKLTADGDIEWGKRVPKRQVTPGTNNLYFSYALASANNGLFVYFNDNPKNFTGGKRSADRTYSLNKQQYATAAEIQINAKSEMDSNRLFDEKKEEMLLLPGLCYQAGPNVFIVCRQHKRTIQFGTVNLIK